MTNPNQPPAQKGLDTDLASGSKFLPSDTRQNQLERLRLRHLRLLDLVAERHSLSAAATALRVSQPAATNMLRELESAFGTTLIVRSTTGSSLTEAGEVALQRLRVALGAIRNAAESVMHRPTVPVVHIGMIPTIGVSILPRLVQMLEAAGSMPRLIIHEATVPALVDMLAHGEIDCLVGRLDLEDGHRSLPDDFVAEVLQGEQLRVSCAVNHPLGLLGTVTLNDLQTAHWVVAPPATRTRRIFEQYFLDAGLVAPVPHIESFSFHTNLCITANTQLLTLAPRSAVTHYASLGRVIDLTLDHPFPIGNVVFVRHRDADFPALEVVAAALRNASPEG